jgi:hypothetical protein
MSSLSFVIGSVPGFPEAIRSRKDTRELRPQVGLGPKHENPERESEEVDRNQCASLFDTR